MPVIIITNVKIKEDYISGGQNIIRIYIKCTVWNCKKARNTDEQISKLLSYEFQALMLLEENPDNKWVLKNGGFVNKDK